MGETEQEEKQVGIGQKIVFGLIMLIAVALYYPVFLNWILMVPAQNLPYPYK